MLLKIQELFLFQGPFETQSMVKCLALKNKVLYAADDQGDVGIQSVWPRAVLENDEF